MSARLTSRSSTASVKELVIVPDDTKNRFAPRRNRLMQRGSRGSRTREDARRVRVQSSLPYARPQGTSRLEASAHADRCRQRKCEGADSGGGATLHPSVSRSYDRREIRR